LIKTNWEGSGTKRKKGGKRKKGEGCMFISISLGISRGRLPIIPVVIGGFSSLGGWKKKNRK